VASVSCLNCPSYATESESLEVFGRVTGCSMCARHGYALDRPGLSDIGRERAAESFALTCPDFGAARPEKPLTYSARVVDPDVNILVETSDPDFRPDNLTTCRACKLCVRDDVVQRELGYPVALCRGKGKLITRPQFEARGCKLAQGGEMSNTTEGLEIRAEFREGFAVPVSIAVGRVTSVGRTQDEPTTYVTDAIVSADDDVKGIRAWRLVKGYKDVYAPIFKPELYTPEERLFIPQTGDATHPELYVDYSNLLYRFVTDTVILGQTLCLQGQPGVGKTEGARWLAWLCQMPFVRFSYDSSTDPEEMMGMKDYSPERGTYYTWGRVPLAYSRPVLIVHDELNLAQPAIREKLRPTFDNSKQLVLDGSMGEIVERHEFTYQIIAQNPAHDFRNVGAQTMADAEYNRMTVKSIPLPPESVERHIIQKWCELDGYEMPESLLSELMQISADIREASTQGHVPFTWGMRQTIKVARLTQYHNMIEAFKGACLDFYEEGVANTVMKFIRDATGLEA